MGTKDAGDTHIISKINNKGEATEFNIRLSSGYRTAPNKKITEGCDDTKAGTIIYETSHLILGTKDHAYGEAGIKTLDKDKAIENVHTYGIGAEIASSL